MTNNHPKYSTVFFDFDGTLLNTEPWKQYEHLFKEPKQGSVEWEKGRKEYLSHVGECKLYDGMDAVLDYIRENHIRVCVVTANTKDRVVAALKAFGWQNIINEADIVGCYALGRKRASKDDGDPSLFVKALEVLGVEAKECVAFGNEANDTKAAKNAGITAYNCLWGTTEDEAKTIIETMPTISLSEPKQILDVVENH